MPRPTSALVALVLAVLLPRTARAQPDDPIVEPGWGVEIQAGPGAAVSPLRASWSGGAKVLRETAATALGGRIGFVRDRVRGDGVLSAGLDVQWSAVERGGLSLGPVVGLGWGIGFYPPPWGFRYWDECGMLPGVACEDPTFSRGVLATLGVAGVERVGRLRLPARLTASWVGKGAWFAFEAGVGLGGRRSW